MIQIENISEIKKYMQREKLRALGIIPLFHEIIITDDIAGHGDVTKFRKPNPICFEIMRLRLDVEAEQMGYVGSNFGSYDVMIGNGME